MASGNPVSLTVAFAVTRVWTLWPARADAWSSVGVAEWFLPNVGVGPQRAAVGEQRNPGDRLDPAGDRQPDIPGAQPGGGVRDGVDPRGAEPVDRQTRNAVTPAGQQCRGARDVGTLLVDLGGAAPR